MLFDVKDIDRQFYERYLADFLPPKMIDVHTHVWLKTMFVATPVPDRGAKWPSLVADDNAIEDLFETYRLMFPGQEVTPLIFGSPRRGVVFEQTNGYIGRAARQHDLPSLIVSTPEWSGHELERRVRDGGFLGLKPYLSFAPPDIPVDEITVFSFLPHQHLQVANEHGWIVMLHLPRRERLRDPINLAQVIEIERRYPHVRLIIAHIGRAYCREDVGSAFQVLRGTQRVTFDFSANTNAWVMERAIRAVGPKRLLFGSDLPILRMRMRRICEHGVYVNLVPPKLYGDVTDDPHMREVSQEEGERLTFFMYEELRAFRCAAEAANLDATDLQDIFYRNAARLTAGARGDGDGSWLA